jgi:putative ABC transport system permease protein
LTMLKNFFKISVRHMMREKSYVFINVTGLGIGLFCSILIGLFVRHELSYDSFHKNKDQIYRVYLEGKLGDTELKGAYTCPPLGPEFLEELPDVLNQVRINTWEETVLQHGDISFIEDHFGEADSGFFQIFSIPLLKGDPLTVLSSVHNLVLSESTALKIFGNEDPVGKALRAGTDTSYYTVTGVMQDFPENSHIHLNAIGSFMSNPRSEHPSWTSNSFYTYLLLQEGTNLENLQEKITETVNTKVGPELQEYLGISIEEFLEAGNAYGYKLQPLTSIHLDPTVQHDLKPSNDRKYIYIFSLVGFLILIMAGINYVNLATARSARRSLEIGIRKISGSDKMSLVIQFLAESFVMVLLAMFLALIFLELSLPYLNNFLGLNLTADYTGQWYTIPSLLLIALVLGLISGTYPAFYLASFEPMQVLSGKAKTGIKGKFQRNILVTIQMTASVLLVFSSILIYRQLDFMLSRDLGYDKENVLVIRRSQALGGRKNTFLEEINEVPGVILASHSTSVPNYPNNHNGYMMEGEAGDKTFLLQTNWVDPDYLETWKMNMREGRFFSEDFGTDSSACIINMSAVRQFGLEEPIGSVFIRPDDNNQHQALRVIGVADDFHYESLHDRIYPYIFILNNPDRQWGFISIRLESENIRETMNEIEKLWNQFANNSPMVYFFMEQDFDNLYKEDRRTGKLSVIFAILTIVIGSLGLFGLTSFTTRARTKEIGIRKVNGAGTGKIMLILYKDMAILILLSTAIAWTTGYYFATGWLQSFYFRTSLSVWEFAGSLLCVFLISILTISWQSYRAASANPAETLKYE